MGAAIYVSLEKAIDGFDPGSIDGKALSKAIDTLNAICKSEKLVPLMEFVSMSNEDVGDLVDDDVVLAQKWYDSAEGLKTVRGLLQQITDKPLDKGNDAVIADLRQMESVLQAAQSKGVRFCFKIDF
jgi:hypothetical protein